MHTIVFKFNYSYEKASFNGRRDGTIGKDHDAQAWGPA